MIVVWWGRHTHTPVVRELDARRRLTESKTPLKPLTPEV
jgi:hypothetical protein